jgi:hypothetical protein
MSGVIAFGRPPEFYLVQQDLNLTPVQLSGKSTFNIMLLKILIHSSNAMKNVPSSASSGNCSSGGNELT